MIRECEKIWNYVSLKLVLIWTATCWQCMITRVRRHQTPEERGREQSNTQSEQWLGPYGKRGDSVNAPMCHTNPKHETEHESWMDGLETENWWLISDLICSQAKYRAEETRDVRSVPARANSGGGECPVRAVQCPQCAADSGYNIRQAADKLSRVQVLAEITRHHNGSVLCHRSQCEKLWLNRENCSSRMLSCCQWNAAEIRINDLCLKREKSQLSVNWAEIRQHVATARQHSQEQPQVQTCYKNINNTLASSCLWSILWRCLNTKSSRHTLTSPRSTTSTRFPSCSALRSPM